MGESRRGACARRGFTLLEMAIVFVILGVTSAIAIPRWATTIRHQRVSQAANVVASDLELASAMAAQRRAALQLRVNSVARTYEVVARASQQVVLQRTLGQGADLSIETLVATPAAVDFLPGGTLSSPMQLVLGASGRQRIVTVSRAGLVKVSR